MLVLSRKTLQGIRIGNAHVKVLSLRDGKVRLGIEAPQEVLILRDELEQEPEAGLEPEAA